MENKIELIDVLNHHLKGGKFEYKSFDFKKAAEEYERTEEWQKIIQNPRIFEREAVLNDKYQIPEEIRVKYSYWRVGKLRTIEFAPSGMIYKIKLGAKYAVVFYDNDLSNLRLID